MNNAKIAELEAQSCALDSQLKRAETYISELTVEKEALEGENKMLSEWKRRFGLWGTGQQDREPVVGASGRTVRWEIPSLSARTPSHREEAMESMEDIAPATSCASWGECVRQGVTAGSEAPTITLATDGGVSSISTPLGQSPGPRTWVTHELLPQP